MLGFSFWILFPWSRYAGTLRARAAGKLRKKGRAELGTGVFFQDNVGSVCPKKLVVGWGKIVRDSERMHATERCE